MSYGAPAELDPALAEVARRGAYSPEHSGRIGALARRVARELGLEEERVDAVRLLARVHDIGKAALPGHLLSKPTPLSPGEQRLLHWHPEAGARLVAGIPRLAHLAPLVRSSHERFDGAGYPDGLAGEAIPLECRIVYACDAFVALLAARPYREALEPAVAHEVFRRNAGTQFCPRVSAALLDVIGAPSAAGEPGARDRPRRDDAFAWAQPPPRQEGVREVADVSHLQQRVPDGPRAHRQVRRAARRDPRRTATVVYLLGALLGLGVALTLAVPVEGAAESCPPAGESRVGCEVQKVGVKLLTLATLCIGAGMLFAHFLVFTLPTFVHRWRNGELRRSGPDFPEDDPVLVAAHWGFVEERARRSRILGKHRFSRRR